MKMLVGRETVVDQWDLPCGGSDEARVVEDKIIDSGRWSIHHSLIVEINGAFWRTKYSVGATEYQDERPWQDNDMVEFVEVRQVEKVVKVWEEA